MLDYSHDKYRAMVSLKNGIVSAREHLNEAIKNYTPEGQKEFSRLYKEIEKVSKEIIQFSNIRDKIGNGLTVFKKPVGWYAKRKLKSKTANMIRDLENAKRELKYLRDKHTVFGRNRLSNAILKDLEICLEKAFILNDMVNKS